MKRGLSVVLVSLFLVVVLSASMVSAGFFGDTWKKLTGNVVTGNVISGTLPTACSLTGFNLNGKSCIQGIATGTDMYKVGVCGSGVCGTTTNLEVITISSSPICSGDSEQVADIYGVKDYNKYGGKVPTIDYENYGRLDSNGGTDVCLDANVLREYFCLRGASYYVEKDCSSNGGSCVNGACVGAPTSADCGNQALDFGEQCDSSYYYNDHMNCNRCSNLDCLSGYGLSRDGRCVATGQPSCGDLQINQNYEECDVPVPQGTSQGAFGDLTFSGGICTRFCKIKCNLGFVVDESSTGNMYCRAILCGDGIADSSEYCDTANFANGGCNNCASGSCNDGFNYDAGTKTCVSDGAPRCGDSIKQTDETCDGGSSGVVSHGRCSSNCEDLTCDSGYGPDGLGACKVVQCGNGIIEADEQCDGPVTNGGCNNCVVSCPGSYPTFDKNSNSCITSGVQTCGDGYVTGIEQCDDGNIVSNDGCSKTCVAECVGGTIDGNCIGTETSITCPQDCRKVWFSKLSLGDFLNKNDKQISKVKLPILLKSGLFEGVSYNLSVDIGSTPKINDVDSAVGLEFSTSVVNYLYNSTVTFASPVNFILAKSKTIVLFGKIYYVSPKTDNTRLVLVRGAERLTLVSQENVEIGNANKLVDGTKVVFVGRVDALKKIMISVAAPTSDSDTISPGSAFVDSVFKTFKVKLDSIAGNINGPSQFRVSFIDASTPALLNAVVPTCGNGIVEGGEQCDSLTDVVDATCTIGCKIKCTKNGYTYDSVKNACGLKECSTRVAATICNDGDSCTTDMCTILPNDLTGFCSNPVKAEKSVCKSSPGLTAADGYCSGTSDSRTCTVNTCGDGVIFGSEKCDRNVLANGECDDGEEGEGTTCTVKCNEPRYKLSDNGKACVPVCTIANQDVTCGFDQKCVNNVCKKTCTVLTASINCNDGKDCTKDVCGTNGVCSNPIINSATKTCKNADGYGGLCGVGSDGKGTGECMMANMACNADDKNNCVDVSDDCRKTGNCNVNIGICGTGTVLSDFMSDGVTPRRCKLQLEADGVCSSGNCVPVCNADNPCVDADKTDCMGNKCVKGACSIVPLSDKIASGADRTCKIGGLNGVCQTGECKSTQTACTDNTNCADDNPCTNDGKCVTNAAGVKFCTVVSVANLNKPDYVTCTSSEGKGYCLSGDCAIVGSKISGTTSCVGSAYDTSVKGSIRFTSSTGVDTTKSDVCVKDSDGNLNLLREFSCANGAAYSNTVTCQYGCAAGACKPEVVPPTCTTQNCVSELDCKTASCVGNECTLSNVAEGTDCGAGKCDADGICQPINPPQCSVDNPCVYDGSNECETSECQNSECKIVSKANGVDCANGRCTNGECKEDNTNSNEGCDNNGVKIAFGARIKDSKDNKNVLFCDPTKELKSVFANNIDCQEDYQCKSNACIDLKCKSVSGVLSAQSKKIDALICTFGAWIRGEGGAPTDGCPGCETDTGYYCTCYDKCSSQAVA